MTNEQREIHRKKRIIEYAERTGNIHKSCRNFGVARSTFYLWRNRYREFGDDGLRSRRKTGPTPTAQPTRQTASGNTPAASSERDRVAAVCVGRLDHPPQPFRVDEGVGVGGRQDVAAASGRVADRPLHGVLDLLARSADEQV